MCALSLSLCRSQLSKVGENSTYYQQFLLGIEIKHVNFPLYAFSMIISQKKRAQHRDRSLIKLSK